MTWPMSRPAPKGSSETMSTSAVQRQHVLAGGMHLSMVSLSCHLHVPSPDMHQRGSGLDVSDQGQVGEGIFAGHATVMV